MGELSGDSAKSSTVYLSADNNIWQTRAVSDEGTFYIAKSGETAWAYTASAGALQIPQGSYDFYYVAGETPSNAASVMTSSADIIVGKTSAVITGDAEITISAKHKTAKVKMLLTNVSDDIEAIRITLHNLYEGVTANSEYSGTSEKVIELENTADNTWSSDYEFVFPSASQDLTISLNATKTDATTKTLESKTTIRLAEGCVYTIRGSYTKINGATLSQNTDDWTAESEEDVDYDSPRMVKFASDTSKDLYVDVEGYDISSVVSYIFSRSDIEFTCNSWSIPTSSDVPNQIRTVVPIENLVGKIAYVSNAERFYYTAEGYSKTGSSNICVVVATVNK